MLDGIKGCEIDFTSQLQTREEGGTPRGLVDNVAFHISFAKGEFLMLTVHQTGSWQTVLSKLTKACVEFMGSKPIIQYCEDDPARITVEWSLVDSEAQIVKIVNGGGVYARLKIRDIDLLGRDISDYESEDLKRKFADEEAERIKNARIYGVDPGGCDIEGIKNSTEWELFLEYYSITLRVWRMNHNGSRDYSRGHMSSGVWESTQKAIAELQYDIEYLMYAISKKIDIDVPEPEVDKHVSPDRDMFMKWYVFYDKHFRKALSDEQWKEFEAKRKAGEDVSEYLPTGDWRES